MPAASPDNVTDASDDCLSVIMPVFNESPTVESVIMKLLQLPIPIQLVIVNDGSSDGTQEILERFATIPSITVIHHATNQGKGSAVRSALANATGSCVVIQDADLEYDPADLPRLWGPIREGTADVVYGSRYATNSTNDSPLWHRLVNRFITTTANISFGTSLTDIETCYKLFPVSVATELLPGLRENRFGVEIELTAKFVARGLRLVEIPISYQRRGYAQGKTIGWKDGLRALWCVWIYRQ